MINILYVIGNLGQGGAERVVINLAKGLDRTRYKPMVCCLYDKGPFAGELEEVGINVLSLNKKHKIEPSIIKRLVSIMQNNDIHIVHTHLWGPNFWGRLAAKIAKTPVMIATEHNEDVWKTGLYFFFDRLLSQATDKLIAVSNSVKKFYTARGINADKIEIIYNGIDIATERMSQPVNLRKEFNIKNNTKILAVIGRLVPQKGHRYFLLALKEILNRYKVKGLIIGSGPLENELKRLTKSLGLLENVIFTGFRQDISQILKEIDILVMPSLREGMPIVALEAMAAGVPIVATTVGGNTELIEDGKTGILVEPSDGGDLAEGIDRILRSPSLGAEIKERAAWHAKDNFSIRKMLKHTEALYEQCLRDKEIL